MRTSAIVTTIGFLLSTFSFAESPVGDNNEREKRKIVSRIYQATYGSIEKCKNAAPSYAAEFESELNNFVAENEELMRLVTQSQYYEYAKSNFSKHAAIDPQKDTTESLSAECKYLSSMLRSMRTQKEGKHSVNAIVEILKK